MISEFANIFNQFAGVWSLERKISSGENLNGKAVFERVSHTVFLLREEGELTLQNGTSINAARDWYWHLLSSQELEITYDETGQEKYHLLDLSLKNDNWLGSSDHLCGDDHYFGSYKFDINSFQIKQTIKGPNKNYSVESNYFKTS